MRALFSLNIIIRGRFVGFPSYIFSLCAICKLKKLPYGIFFHNILVGIFSFKCAIGLYLKLKILTSRLWKRIPYCKFFILQTVYNLEILLTRITNLCLHNLEGKYHSQIEIYKKIFPFLVFHTCVLVFSCCCMYTWCCLDCYCCPYTASISAAVK